MKLTRGALQLPVGLQVDPILVAGHLPEGGFALTVQQGGDIDVEGKLYIE